MREVKKIFVLILLILVMLCTKSLGIMPESTDFFEGIDVSNWQGYIDYEQVKKAEIDIVYIEASVGQDYKDPYFELNYENAKLNGLKVGAYHYLTAQSITEAEREAEFFASVISGKSIDCKLAMDFEEFGNLNKEQINEISRTFLEKIEELTGKETIIYSDLSNSQDIFQLSENYPVWISYYGNYVELENINTDWRKWQGQQYTDIGNISGISGYVDRDLFTAEILLDDNSKIIEIESDDTKINSHRIEYIVKSEDTLWAISKEYNTSVIEIANLNEIENPNIINIGERLTIITNTNFKPIHSLGKTFYTVKSGDTLYALASKFNTTVEKIVELNNIKNPNYIYIGQRLRI